MNRPRQIEIGWDKDRWNERGIEKSLTEVQINCWENSVQMGGWKIKLQRRKE